SPIPNDDGSVGGIICANTDGTQRVISERQLALLRDLAAGTADARNWQEACERSARALASSPRDLPFAMIYMAEAADDALSLAASCGIAGDHPAAPRSIRLDAAASWPIGEALRRQGPVVVDDPGVQFGADLPS